MSRTDSEFDPPEPAVRSADGSTFLPADHPHPDPHIDAEIEAMQTTVDALTPLPEEARRRVVYYIIERFAASFITSDRLR